MPSHDNFLQKLLSNLKLDQSIDLTRFTKEELLIAAQLGMKLSYDSATEKVTAYFPMEDGRIRSATTMYTIDTRTEIDSIADATPTNVLANNEIGELTVITPAGVTCSITGLGTNDAVQAAGVSQNYGRMRGLITLTMAGGTGYYILNNHTLAAQGDTD